MTEWPYARVLAEAVARPFLDGAAFRTGLVALQRTEDHSLEKSTQELARELEERQRLRAGGVSLEVLRQARDYVWFGQPTHGPSTEPRISVRLHDLLRRAACIFEDPDTSLPERAHRQRWLTLAVPGDLLLAATAPVRADLSVPRLEALLNDGVAQVHCHLSACLSFPALWTYLMATAGNSQVDASRLATTDTPFGSKDEFLAWLAAAGLARLTLAQFLHSNGQRGTATPVTFATFLIRQKYIGPIERMAHQDALAALHHGSAPLSVAQTQAAYRRYVVEHSVLPVCRSLEDLANADPVGRCFPEHPSVSVAANEPVWAESRFCGQALHYLQSERGGNDALFRRLFWQYQRVRCATFRFVTQEPGTRGLDWFVRFFKRISPMRKGLGSDVLMDAAIRHSSPPREEGTERTTLRKVEVRISPKSCWSKLREELNQIDHAQCQRDDSGKCRPRDTQVHRGVVLHFQKDGFLAVPGSRQGGAQGYGLTFVRFARQYEAHRKETDAVSALLDADPSILRILRGLDVCGRELTQPTWLLLPLLYRLRRESQELVRGPRSPGKTWELRMTIHAGEDYRTPLEGLRRIDEPIDFGLLKQHDRIGHAVALGIDAEKWVNQHAVIFQPAEERLEDILWLFDRGVLRGLPKADGQRLMEGFWRLAKHIYSISSALNPAPVLRALIQARRMRHDPTLLLGWNYPELNLAPERPAQFSATDFLLRYLTDVGVWRRGQEPREIPMNLEQAAIARAQRFVQRQIRARDITIEANPTSNLLIAELGSLDQHPVFRLAPISRRRWITPEYRIALSDDDPLTFATSLLDEYRHTYFAILRQGYPEDAAICWLKKRRKDAIDAAFTVAESVRCRQRESDA